MAAYVPLGHRAPKAWRRGCWTPLRPLPRMRGRGRAGAKPRLSLEEALARLKPLLEDPGVLKIGHDMKGMAHLLLRYGIAVAPYDCTMLMSYVLDGGQVEHTIEALTRRAFVARSDPGQGDPRHRQEPICFAEVATARGRDFAASEPMRRCACTRC